MNDYDIKGKKAKLFNIVNAIYLKKKKNKFSGHHLFPFDEN